MLSAHHLPGKNIEAVIIYSDGGADPNPGIGGWAALLRYGDHEKVLTGNDPRTTNNRMELEAAIGALGALKRPSRIEFHTDSEYLRRGILDGAAKWQSAGWVTKGGKPVPNADLWRKLQSLVAVHDINWHWVQGHSGDPLNERVDVLAREARLSITPKVDLESGIPRLYLRASCSGNPGPGRWAVVLESNSQWEECSGRSPDTTNNRMELTSAIEGIQMLAPGDRVQIFTTSDYLYQGATRWITGWQGNGWRKKDGQPVANSDLWQTLATLSGHYQLEWFNAKNQRFEGLERAGRLASAE